MPDRTNAIVDFILKMRYRPNLLNGGSIKVLTLAANQIVDVNYLLTDKGEEQLNQILR